MEIIGSTLYLAVGESIGQVKVSEAIGEITRLENQGSGSYRQDFTPFMYTIDEADEDINNPCKLSDGYCWVIKNLPLNN